MELDLTSLIAVNLIIECIAGAIFVVHALRHPQSQAARAWALAFLASILTTVCYLAWALAPGAWLGNAFGNAAFAAGIGCLWLGAARYNSRRMRLRVGAVALAAGLAFLASIFDVRDPWAGAPALFAILTVLAALGAVESARGAMRRRPLALALVVVLALTSAWQLARLALFIAFGPDTAVFDAWGGSVNAAILTAALSVVALTATAVLVAEEDRDGEARFDAPPASGFGPMLAGDAFARLADGMGARARAGGGRIAVLALVVPDLERVRLAFGIAEAAALHRRFVDSALRRFDPSTPVATTRPGLVVAVLSGRTPEATERAARALHRLVAEDLATGEGAVVPLVSAGLAFGQSARGAIADAVAAAELAGADEATNLAVVHGPA